MTASREFLPFVICAVIVLCPFAEAQQPKKIPRVGFLTGIDQPTGHNRYQEFRSALRELGYIEGQNLAIEYRNSEGNLDRFPEFAAELVRLKVDIIVVAAGLPAIQAAKNATKTIPIVMAGRGIDPVMAGLVESLARPGGNITGVTNLSRELGGKRLELLKEVVPSVRRIGVLYEAANPGSLRELKELLPVAARELGLMVRSWEIRDADAFKQVFAAVKKERPDGLYVSGGQLMNINRNRTAGFALKSHLPSVGSSTAYADGGGLMSYDGDTADAYRRVAIYVDKILKGARAADLPVEQPTKFDLVINLKTAKQIGLMIPPNVLARADRVIR